VAALPTNHPYQNCPDCLEMIRIKDRARYRAKVLDGSVS
jgi:hypothetical protein